MIWTRVHPVCNTCECLNYPNMLSYLTMATIFGLSTGFAPGPLLTLVISETLRHDKQAGIKIAIAPLITGTPIVILVLFLFTQIDHVDALVGGIAMLGGGFVFYLGLTSLRIKPVELELATVQGNSLIKGVVTNFLNPAPYLFWVGVGAPVLLRAYDDNPWYAVLFMTIFYGLMVSSKILLAVLTAQSRSFLSGSIYINIMRLLGATMCLLAFSLIYDGMGLMGFV